MAVSRNVSPVSGTSTHNRMQSPGDLKAHGTNSGGEKKEHTQPEEKKKVLLKPEDDVGTHYGPGGVTKKSKPSNMDVNI